MLLAQQKTIKEVKGQSPPPEARVTISGYFYAVDLGPDAALKNHRVGKDKRCTCNLGVDCPAVQAVADYLRAGGERASEPPVGFFPVVPQACPVCGGETYYLVALSSKHRGIGWACRRGGEAHYWTSQVNAFRQHLVENPWIYPPVVGKDERILYPGLRRDELITESRPWPEGYDPNR
jgi:hypothetical protein